jgi:DNA-binding IclR family transcriptional regulator
MGKVPDPKESPSAAVERALAILEAVAQGAAGLTNAEISRKLRIPKSSASYILRTLEKTGYLRRDEETSRYRVGVKVFSLSRSALTGIDAREIAMPIMRDIVARTRLTCHLAILDGSEAVYIEKVDAPGFIKVDTWVGRRMCVHTTSVGKALAAYLPPPRVQKILDTAGMERRTPHSITKPAPFFKELERVREQGYALDNEENSLGARCFGVPIFNQSDEVEASLGLSGTIGQVNPQTLPQLVDDLKDAAWRISRHLGWRGTRKKVSAKRP